MNVKVVYATTDENMERSLERHINAILSKRITSGDYQYGTRIDDIRYAAESRGCWAFIHWDYEDE